MVARSQYLFACCALLLATNVHATEWKTHTYVADGFQVEFSGQVEAVESKLSDDVKKQVIRSTTYRQDGGDYGYQVFATLYSVKPNLDSAVKGALAHCKTTISITSITIPNGIGREVFAENWVVPQFEILRAAALMILRAPMMTKATRP